MLIGFEKRFMFVANTKTASTSIEHVLRPHADIVHGGTPANKHIALGDAIHTFRPRIEAQGLTIRDMFKFGVMRDPVEWISSWYRYRKGNDVENPLPETMDFTAFWERKDWNILRRDGRKYLQSDIFCAPDGSVMADMIIPHGQVEAQFARIRQLLEVTAELPRKNVSRLSIPDVVPEDLKPQLRAFYADDYALFQRLEAINVQGLAKLQAQARPKVPRGTQSRSAGA